MEIKITPGTRFRELSATHIGRGEIHQSIKMVAIELSPTFVNSAGPSVSADTKQERFFALSWCIAGWLAVSCYKLLTTQNDEQVKNRTFNISFKTNTNFRKQTFFTCDEAVFFVFK